jgi:glycosyltransferase
LNSNPKITIITPVLNNIKNIQFLLDNISSQTYKNIEHIIIDGGSTDGTIKIIEDNITKNSRLIIQKDRGLYFALNNGINLSSGDILSFLHSDDLYVSRYVLEKIADTFVNNDIDGVYGDLEYVRKDNINKVVRYWKSGRLSRVRLLLGWMPPHPTLFLKRDIYRKYGLFNTTLRIASDYEFMLRVLLGEKRLRLYYIQEVLVRMRYGGISNRGILALLKKSMEDYKVMRLYGVNIPCISLVLKNISKIPQFILRRKNG